jgi:hypothetical protein
MDGVSARRIILHDDAPRVSILALIVSLASFAMTI